MGVVWWVVKKQKNETADYFLAGRNLSWWIIGASIFASNIGSEHIVGLAGSGAKFNSGELTLEDLRNIAIKNGEPRQISGKQELYEQIIADKV